MEFAEEELPSTTTTIEFWTYPDDFKDWQSQGESCNNALESK